MHVQVAMASDGILGQCETSAELSAVSATVGWERTFLPSAACAEAPYNVSLIGLHPALLPITLWLALSFSLPQWSQPHICRVRSSAVMLNGPKHL